MLYLEIIFIYFLTIVTSLGINTLKDLITIKDVVDAGYLIDSKKTYEFNQKVREINKLNSLNFMLIPGLNLLCSLAETFLYLINRNQFLMQLNMLDCLRKMPDTLKEEYESNPGLINAFNICIKDISNDQIMRMPTKEMNEFNEYGSLDEFKKDFEENKTVSLDETIIPNIEAEEARIDSIALCQITKDESYFQLNLRDQENNQIGVFGSPYLTTPEDFRKETFGILSAINCQDLLKLGGNYNWEIPIKFKCDSRDNVNELINEKGERFHISNKGEYQTESLVDDEREVFSGKITQITSASDTFTIQIESENFTTHYVTGNLYYGFGYPLLSKTNNETVKSMACSHYKSYLENILKFLGQDDLLRIGGEPSVLPSILIQRDENGNIIAIGSSENEYHLRINDNHYKIEKGRLIPRKKIEKKLI